MGVSVIPTRGQNQAFREWAAGQGLRVRKQPDTLQGEGDIYAIPLMGRRGWLWDASPTTLGLHLVGLPIYLNPRAALLAGQPRFRLQTHAVDAILGWLDRDAWEAVLRDVAEPIRAPRVNPAAQAKAAARLKGLRPQN